jgi:hypothetical protein
MTKSISKKTLIALAMLATAIGVSTPVKSANAGVISVLAGAASVGTDPAGGIAGVAVGGLVAWGGYMLAHNHNSNWRPLGIVLIVLDAKQELTADGIESYLTQNYSFLDDREVVADLATMIKTKLLASGATQKAMEVHFSEAEVRQVLAGSSVTADQANLMVQTLK